MLPTIYLKNEVEPGQTPLNFINLWHNAIQVAKHTTIVCL